MWGQAGAQHVDTVQGGLGVDVAAYARMLNESSVILMVKCLAILYLLTLPIRSRSVSRPRAGGARGGWPQRYFPELFFGGGQQLAAFAGAFFGQRRVAAAHQPLAGIVGMG